MCKSCSNWDCVRAALAAQRKALKIRLRRERQEPASQHTIGDKTFVTEWLPLGAYCGIPITHANDTVMHEWLIKRSSLPVKLQHLIMHEYNCVLVHFDCHEQHGQTQAFKLRCARAQYKRYGRDTIVAWVESLDLRQTVWIPTEEEAHVATHTP